MCIYLTSAMKPLILLALAATGYAETTLTATVLTPQQAKKRFGIDLHKLGYTAVANRRQPGRPGRGGGPRLPPPRSR